MELYVINQIFILNPTLSIFAVLARCLMSID